MNLFHMHFFFPMISFLQFLHLNSQSANHVHMHEVWCDIFYFMNILFCNFKLNSLEIAISCRPKSYFFVFSQLLLFPCRKTLVLRFFSINSKVILKNSRPTAENFSILLENLLKKIEIQVFFDTEATTARRNKKIRLWQKGT